MFATLTPDVTDLLTTALENVVISDATMVRYSHVRNFLLTYLQTFAKKIIHIRITKSAVEEFVYFMVVKSTMTDI